MDVGFFISSKNWEKFHSKHYLIFLFGYFGCIWMYFHWAGNVELIKSSLNMLWKMCVCLWACKPLNTRAVHTEYIYNRLITSTEHRCLVLSISCQAWDTIMTHHYSCHSNRKTSLLIIQTSSKVFSVPNIKLEITLREKKIMKKEHCDTSNSICWDN